MKKLFSILFLILIIQLIAVPVFAGKCTGSSNCRACSSCSSCKHCAKNGGTCSVCSEDVDSNNALGFPVKTLALGAGAAGIVYFLGKRNRKN